MSGYVARWLDDGPDHPVIAELKARPGEWGVLWDPDGPRPDGWWKAYEACKRHRNVETQSPLAMEGGQPAMARYIPDPIPALARLLAGRS